MQSVLFQVRLFQAGHITRMGDKGIFKVVFFGKLREGKRDRGASKKHYKEQLKRQLANAGININTRRKEAGGRKSGQPASQ